MAEKKQPVYDESKIKTLSSLEHIRLRSGMYIGRLGDYRQQRRRIHHGARTADSYQPRRQANKSA